MPAESSLEKEIVAHAQELGMLSFKFTSPAQRGVPDRIFLNQGRVLFLEIKAWRKKPTKLQYRMMQKLREHGVACWWTDNFGSACAILHDFRISPAQFNSLYAI